MTGRGGDQIIPRPRDWRPGPTARWHGRDLPLLGLTDVEARLAGYEPVDIVRGPPVDRAPAEGPASAVLVALYDGPDGATTILTKRPEHMCKHAGEIAFPGGAIDDTDADPWAAALREAHEEVALAPGLPRQIGALDRFVTGASFSLVAPLVGALDEPPTLTPSPDEVASILHVPLAELLHPDVHREEQWMFDGAYRTLHFFELVGETVWGATALMLHRLLSVLTDP